MEGATHFIEVYRIYSMPYYSQTSIAEINDLKYYLMSTKQKGLKTIAVWQIKLKNKLP